MSRKKQIGLLISLLALVGTLVGGASWRTYRELHQEQINRQLIEAIKRNDTPAVLSALRQGADANAQDKPPDLRPIWRIFLDMLQGKRPAISHEPSALIVALELQPGEMAICYDVETAPIVQ